jgi:hypothetical protein
VYQWQFNVIAMEMLNGASSDFLYQINGAVDDNGRFAGRFENTLALICWVGGDTDSKGWWPTNHRF